MACKRLSYSIIIDTLHPLHSCLANALSTSSTRSSFKPLQCRNSLYRNIIISSLARLLVNPDQYFLRSTLFIVRFTEHTWKKTHTNKANCSSSPSPLHLLDDLYKYWHECLTTKAAWLSCNVILWLCPTNSIPLLASEVLFQTFC